MSISEIVTYTIGLLFLLIIIEGIRQVATYKNQQKMVIAYLQKHGPSKLKEINSSASFFSKTNYSSLYLMEEEDLVMSKKLENGQRIYKINNGEGW